MTAFDIVFLLIVIVSALVGYARGAIKELVTLFAFLLAALALPTVIVQEGGYDLTTLGPLVTSTLAAFG